MHFTFSKELFTLFILNESSGTFKETPVIQTKKAPENICIINFVNKGIEHINISRILNLPEAVQSLPESLHEEEKLPKIVMKLGSSIRNKIMKYEATVRSIQHTDDDDVSFTLNSESNSTFPCDCSNSSFCDPHHGHIVTGDLRIVENAK